MENILVLTYWSYRDALIQTYTLPYVRIMKSKLPVQSLIYLVTLEKERSVLYGENKIKITAELEAAGIKWIPILYKSFGFGAYMMWLRTIPKLLWLIMKRKITTIHCWCTPAGAIGYVLAVLSGRRLILDSYEPHAESMVENGTWERNSWAFKILFWLERKQTERATYIIASTQGMKSYAELKYGVRIKNFAVKPACVDLDLFDMNKVTDDGRVHEPELADKIVCVYAGKFGGIYLEQEIFELVKVAANHWGQSFRFLILTSHTEKEIMRYCELAELPRTFIVTRFVPHHQVPGYMGLASFAITPVKPVPTKKYCTPIKDGEYWALGLPVIISENISDDSEIIESNNIGSVLRAFNPFEYQKAILKISELLKKEEDLRSRIRQIAVQFRGFNIADKVYEGVYNQNNVSTID